MNARSRAARYLMSGRGMTHDEAEDMLQLALDEHAHELAEKIRADAYAYKNVSFERLAAADLVDPKAEK